jgi:hypothetical protein
MSVMIMSVLKKISNVLLPSCKMTFKWCHDSKSQDDFKRNFHVKKSSSAPYSKHNCYVEVDYSNGQYIADVQFLTIRRIVVPLFTVFIVVLFITNFQISILKSIESTIGVLAIEHFAIYVTMFSNSKAVEKLVKKKAMER